MRKLVDRSGHVLRVVEFFMVRNMWEYYVLEAKTNTDDIKLCLVLGAENEIGDVSMSEVKPYVISRERDLSKVMPAPGYSWAS